MINLELPSKEQIVGLAVFHNNPKLSSIVKYGKKSTATDFAILLGESVIDDYAIDGGGLENRTGCYWLNDYPKVISFDGLSAPSSLVNMRCIGLRPTMRYSSIKDNSIEINDDEVLFGEYPQMIASSNVSKRLELLYELKDENLKITGKKYITDSHSDIPARHNDQKAFEPREHIEYGYKGEKYIRFVADEDSNIVLSDGTKVKANEVYWIKVEPIVWLIDKEKDTVISKKTLLSGLNFIDKNSYSGDYKNTPIKRFMDNYLSKDILIKQVNQKTNIISNDEDFDSIFETAIARMNEINSESEVKVLKKR